MLRRIALYILLLLPLGLFAQSGQERPWVRWWWNGDKVDTVELKRELQLLHDAGIGGVEINPIEFPSKRCDSLGIASLVWLSDDWITALEATLREARRLGMGCDLLVGSGWPFGMETLPMEYRSDLLTKYANAESRIKAARNKIQQMEKNAAKNKELNKHSSWGYEEQANQMNANSIMFIDDNGNIYDLKT